jgi:putative hemin transport protein
VAFTNGHDQENLSGRDERLAGTALREALLALRDRAPGIRTRDAARELGVTEAELAACRVGDSVVRLKPEFAEIIRALPEIGEVMALTRNEHCVHEKHGAFGNVSIGPGHGIVLNHDVDLRLFMEHWHFGFCVTEEVTSGVRTSLQFFDRDGTAVHKIYLTNKTDREKFDALLLAFSAPEQTLDIDIVPPAPRLPDRPDAAIDTAGFLTHWNTLQDTHDFFGLLNTFGVSRHQAMRLADGSFTRRIEPASLRHMLEAASSSETPIMCFVGNRGCIQIHTGPVKTLKTVGPWFNILDPGFNLHLREDAIAEAWVVRKPTRDGDVTSLELYDEDGFCFVQFFGERKPRKPELDSWRGILREIPALETSGAAA